jgi:hypothetical protein
MNDLLLSLAMAALGQLGGYGAAPGMGGGSGIGIGPGMGYPQGMGPGIRIGIQGGGVPMGMRPPYGGYPGGGLAPGYPAGINRGTGYPGQGYPRGGFPGQGTRLVPGYPTTALPQRPSNGGPAPSSEAEAFGLAPYR